MKIYKDVDKDSGVEAYKYGEDFIDIHFKSGSRYRYTYRTAGVKSIEKMKSLADSGEDLNKYVNENDPGFE